MNYETSALKLYAGADERVITFLLQQYIGQKYVSLGSFSNFSTDPPKFGQ